MISFVKGPLVEIFEDTVVIESGNVGFEIHVPIAVNRCRDKAVYIFSGERGCHVPLRVFKPSGSADV